MKTDFYKQYLASKEWQKKRRDAYVALGRKCRRCKSSSSIVVHHLSYERLGHEEVGDLIILCRVCHDAVHEGFEAYRNGKVRYENLRWFTEWFVKADKLKEKTERRKKKRKERRKKIIQKRIRDRGNSTGYSRVVALRPMPKGKRKPVVLFKPSKIWQP